MTHEKEQHIRNTLIRLSDQDPDQKAFDYRSHLYKTNYIQQMPLVYPSQPPGQILSSWGTSRPETIIVNSNQPQKTRLPFFVQQNQFRTGGFRLSLPRIAEKQNNSNSSNSRSMEGSDQLDNLRPHKTRTVVVQHNDRFEQALVMTQESVFQHKSTQMISRNPGKQSCFSKLATVVLKLPGATEQGTIGIKPTREIIHYKPVNLNKSYEAAKKATHLGRYNFYHLRQEGEAKKMQPEDIVGGHLRQKRRKRQNLNTQFANGKERGGERSNLMEPIDLWTLSKRLKKVEKEPIK